MKRFPRLTVEALRRIETAEKEAEKLLADNVRPYTPGNSNWRRTRDNILEGGYRVIEFICSYAETVFDTHATEYDWEALRSSGIVRNRIIPLVRKQAFFAWGSWTFVTSLLGPPRISREKGSKPGEIVVPASPTQKRYLGLEHVSEVDMAFIPGDIPVDSQLASGRAELEERYQYQLEQVLVERASYWENRGTEVAPTAMVEQEPEGSGDLVARERKALITAYKAEGTKRGIRITDRMIAEAASPTWHERTPVQRWKRNDPRCTPVDDRKIRSVLRKKPHLQ